MVKLRCKTMLWYTDVMVVFQDIEDVEEWLEPFS